MAPGAVTVCSPNINQTDPHSRTKERETIPWIQPQQKKEGLSANKQRRYLGKCSLPRQTMFTLTLTVQSQEGAWASHCVRERCPFQPLENKGDHRLFRRSSSWGEDPERTGFRSHLQGLPIYFQGVPSVLLLKITGRIHA